MSNRDIVSDAVEIARSLVPSITLEQGLQIERALRAKWGGQTIDYVAKTCSGDRDLRRQLQGRTAPQVERAAVSDYLANKPIDTITQEHGISRRTLYRMVKR